MTRWYSNKHLVNLVGWILWDTLNNTPSSINITDEETKHFNSLLTDEEAHSLLIKMLDKLISVFDRTIDRENPEVQFTSVIRETLIGVAADVVINPSLLPRLFHASAEMADTHEDLSDLSEIFVLCIRFLCGRDHEAVIGTRNSKLAYRHFDVMPTAPKEWGLLGDYGPRRCIDYFDTSDADLFPSWSDWSTAPYSSFPDFSDRNDAEALIRNVYDKQKYSLRLDGIHLQITNHLMLQGITLKAKPALRTDAFFDCIIALDFKGRNRLSGQGALVRSVDVIDGTSFFRGSAASVAGDYAGAYYYLAWMAASLLNEIMVHGRTSATLDDQEGNRFNWRITTPEPLIQVPKERPKIRFQQPHEGVNSLYNKLASTQCLHDADCKDKAIKSHTISEGRILKQIADDSYVMRIEAHWDNGTLTRSLSETGLKEATAFNGFCSTHDKSIFETIDNTDYVPGDDTQALLYAYRAAAYNYWSADADEKMEGYIRNVAQKGNGDLLAQIVSPQFKDIDYFNIRKQRHEERIAERDRARIFLDKLRTTLKSDTHDRFQHTTVTLDKPYPLAVSGVFTYGTESPPQRACINIFPQDEVTIVIFTYEPTDTEVGRFIQSLAISDDKMVKMWLTHILAVAGDTLSINPGYWKALPNDTREAFLQHIKSPKKVIDESLFI